MLRSLVMCRSFALNRALNTMDTNKQYNWDIVTAVCVERVPVVTPPLNKLQQSFKELLASMELEKSMKSDHELRREKDKKQAELLKNESADIDMDAVSKITAQDFEDACNEEFANFKFADIETEADKNNDKTSTDRCLQRHLVLVANHKLGPQSKMILPQGKRNEGETLRQTAERVLSEHCGNQLDVQFYGNAPCGFYKYKYPSELNGKHGAKVFFYYAKFIKGVVSSKDKKQYQWLSRKELKEILPERYCKSVDEFLIDEDY